MSLIPEEILTQILMPVSEQAPCGDSKESILNTDSPATDEIVDLEMKHDTATKKIKLGEKAEWRDVFELSAKILGHHCKHAQFLVQWLDTVPQLYDFEGLAQALDVVAKVIEKYPRELHPNPEGKATRKLEIISKLAASNSFNEAVQRIPFPRNSEKESQVSYLHSVYAKYYEEASETERISYRDLGYCSRDELTEQLSVISPENCKKLIDSLEACIGATLKLDQVLNQQKEEALLQGNRAEDHVGFLQLKRNLESILQYAKTQLPNAKEETSNDASAGQDSSTLEDTSSKLDQKTAIFTLGSSVQGTLESRRNALNLLSRLAEFFRKTEPHSPISYSLQQAVRWADLSLPELIEELVPANAREEVRLRVGAPPPKSSDS
jgi:type VI secretion system protein ImpA